MAHILLVEDEKKLRDGLRDNLAREGYRVTVAEDGERALELWRSGSFDLVLLDIMLPKKSGLAVCGEIRQKDMKIPILMLTAKSEEYDVVMGLEAGADDYVTKPFGLAELLARIKARLRRAESAGRANRLEQYEFGDVRIDFRKMEAFRGRKPMSLTKLEFDLLEYLIRRRTEVVSRDDLLREVWGYEHAPFTRTVDNHIAHLRKQIEKDPSKPRWLVSVRSVGYKFLA